MKQMIAKLHEKGFRVIMDVVYNHLFDRQTSSFENIVPNYYFKTREKMAKFLMVHFVEMTSTLYDQCVANLLLTPVKCGLKITDLMDFVLI